MNERAKVRTGTQRRMQVIVLGVVALVILFQLASQALAIAFLLGKDIDSYRVALAVSAVSAAVLDTLFLLLVWILFDALLRMEREADRLQLFMDTVYRRMP